MMRLLVVVNRFTGILRGELIWLLGTAVVVVVVEGGSVLIGIGVATAITGVYSGFMQTKGD